MSKFGPDADPERTMVIYFKRESGAVAKTFAQHLRARGNVTVQLVWGQQFRGPDNVQFVGAVVLEQGVPNAGLIVDSYKARSPETEIHWMTSEGQWADAGTEDTDTERQPEPVSTETEGQAETPADSVAESEEPDDIADVDGFDAADDAAAGDSEDPRETA